MLLNCIGMHRIKRQKAHSLKRCPYFQRVRVQCHASTDSHDQVGPNIEAHMKTFNIYGHNLPTHTFTDNPNAINNFQSEFPSLVDCSNASLNNLPNTMNNSDEDDNNSLPQSEMNVDQIF